MNTAHTHSQGMNTAHSLQIHAQGMHTAHPQLGYTPHTHIPEAHHTHTGGTCTTPTLKVLTYTLQVH